ncbi:MAG: hypothetical protein V3T17_01610 [Pseudomonadales bacterium]
MNDLYLEKLELDNKIAMIDLRNGKIANIALFLQIAGLILVLSKDLAGD